MITFFRKIRQNLIQQNKISKYFKYAIGEIVLVVIGILIALQINNWNESKNQNLELNDALQSIANGVQSDLRELHLLSSARSAIKTKIDTLYTRYIPLEKQSMSIVEATYVNYTFTDISKTIQFNSNLSGFESLKNSTYFGKIQGTDLSLLLSTYFINADKIRVREEQYNKDYEDLKKEWMASFRNNGQDLFLKPWDAGDFTIVGPKFLEILRDDLSLNILELAGNEHFFIRLYEDQILLGNKLVEMIRDSKTSFDEQTKLELSGVLYSFGDADVLSLLINGEATTGFDVRYAASDLFYNYFSKEKGYLSIKYPADQYLWASSYFQVVALRGRVNEMDFSGYSKVFIEMRGEKGGETFEITMKDINDPPDGSETKLKIELTKEWETFEIETSQFTTADMNRIMVPLAFVFVGSEGMKINVKSVQFKKD
ncbi:DUF6090 family protein [uncultured Winogradskyella sp.]|uniref:DUF6090 family protein n=1 Tax=uncultured Winogradskyella sp. TaxID=395353 RepID=UPI00262FB816|nr:DUF6090 family protein [uncultured Winogradskyella sp.]